MRRRSVIRCIMAELESDSRILSYSSRIHPVVTSRLILCAAHCESRCQKREIQKLKKKYKVHEEKRQERIREAMKGTTKTVPHGRFAKTHIPPDPVMARSDAGACDARGAANLHLLKHFVERRHQKRCFFAAPKACWSVFSRRPGVVHDLLDRLGKCSVSNWNN